MRQITGNNLVRTYGGTLAALVGLMVLFSFTNDYFFNARNLGNILLQMTVVALLAYGMTYVLMLGEIDLSVGSIVAVSGVSLGLMLQAGWNPWLAIVVTMAVGIACGFVNGWLSAYLKIPTFIVTVATMGIFRGVGQALTNAKAVSVDEPTVEWLGTGEIAGIGVPIIIMLIVLLVMNTVLTRTKFGRQAVLTGGNRDAARFAGIKVQRLQVKVFIIIGACAALAGILLTSRQYSAQPNAADGYELDAIAAAVLGGTSLNGGRGTVFGTFIGALIIAVVNNGMNLMGVESYLQKIVKGVIIILAVWVDVRSKRPGKAN
ncbi:ABC transporter permease [Cellulomonas sp. NPDC089187]|uniref:ABC transporter permease n=1 Tax=Cellulomonas sp. NPDC089187 TaxID=3154970 RepID=UPI0034223047